MKVRKVGGKQEVRLHLRRRVGSKGEAYRVRKIFQALRAEAKRQLDDGITASEHCLIRDRLEEFLSDKRAGLGCSPCRQKTVERHRKRLQAFDRAFGFVPLAAIGRPAVERWMKKRHKAVNGDTVNADLISLRAFARWAQRKGYAPKHLELLLVDRMRVRGKLPGKNQLPPKALEMEELLRIIRRIGAEKHDLGLVLRGMALFGLRPEAVAYLRRGDVKFPRGKDLGRLYCRGLKGRPDRDIPVERDSPQHQWLKSCLALGDLMQRKGARAPLVPHLKGCSLVRPGGWTTGSIDMVLRRLCGRLKIRFTAYQVRHSVVSWLQTQGESLAGVQTYADHGKVTTQTAYSHRHGREAVSAFRRVGAAMRDMM